MRVETGCKELPNGRMNCRPSGAAFAIGLAAVTVMTTMLLVATVSFAENLTDGVTSEHGEHTSGRQTVSFGPQYEADQIIVSFADRRLYHITARGRAVSYPIAVPRAQSRWQGTTVVSMKRENPSWIPTPDMLRENPRLPSWVPGGHPMNPLGVRALYLGETTYRIHGTDAPWTIGTAASKGCIRMFNEDVLHLYPLIPVGTRVTVTWEKFKTGVPVAVSDERTGPTHGPATNVE